ncbi:Initiation-specific alpha-1,6-mannosyltransferase [Cyphellophora attinorum]|uniref:Initiation-specific alpha-1,6-mannosyltransferase n=1 Tax=Cyphellophora attinorum TaxID=1664694 RepID=A0A0N1HCR5_9EURO|nr:Initiation-specific alpha-1,6-mannosyltransferase [Phialophora attinorum]KPI42224.1 Initiation-specific alpha-1,6-mannosyltransferase [Phialophora attinorum]
MALSPIARKGVVIAAVILALYFFLVPAAVRSVSAPPPAAVPADSSFEQHKDSKPSRPYPPPPAKNQKPIEDVSTKPLRERLKYHFPYDIESKFPAYVWQTWKAAPGSGDFADRLRPFEASWTEKHPGFVHEVITDDAAPHLINYLYASVPEVARAYRAMPLPVIKADFFRYLILLARGGIYSDIDTKALKPATDWLPADFDKASAGLVIGIEADPDREDWAEWYARRIQFCQWTIQSKPGHPVLLDIVATITEKTLQMQSSKTFLKGDALQKSIMDYTGPGIWTDTIFRYLNNKDYFDFSDRKTNVTYSDFFNLEEQKRIGDVVVLPITSFSPGVGQMGAKDTDHPLAFVKHEFDGSWKPEDDKTRKKHD